MPTVREIMTADPEQVDIDTNLREALTAMRDLDVGSLPVVAQGKLVGIITDRDITVRVIAEDRNPDGVQVGEALTTNPVTARPQMDVAEASRLMAQHQIRRLPVVDGGRLVGILALGDVAVDASPRTAGAALKEISTPSEPER
jgi:CBS domain-containing protein